MKLAYIGRLVALVSLAACSFVSSASAGEQETAPRPTEAKRTIDDVVKGLGEGVYHEFAKLPLAEREAAIPLLIEAMKTHESPSVFTCALCGIGQAAVPHLTEALTSESWKIRAASARSLGDMGKPAQSAVPKLREALEDENPEVRKSAVLALGSLDSLNPATIAPLIELLNGPDSSCAAKGLAAAGNAAVPALVKTLETDKSRWYAAADALRQMNGGIEPAIPALVGVLSYDGKDRRADSRSAASRALAVVADASAPHVARILNLPDVPKNYVDHGNGRFTIISESRYRDVIRFFEETGRRSASAVPVLLEVLRTGNNPQRIAAMDCLQHIGCRALPALADLRRMTTDGTAGVRLAACRAIGRIGPLAGEALPEISRLLKDEEALCRAEAVEALVCTQLDTASTIPKVIAALSDKDPQVKDRAAQMVACIGQPARAAAPLLVAMLRSAEPSKVSPGGTTTVVERLPPAIGALAAIKPLDEKLAEHMVSIMIKKQWHQDHSLAIASLDLIDEQARGAAPALAKLLKKDEGARSWAFKALAKMGKHAAPALDYMLTHFEQAGRCRDYPYLDVDRIWDKIGELAIPDLMKICRKHEQKRVRHGALQLLCELASKQAISIYIEALKKEEGNSVTAPEPAMDALFRLGPVAKETVPALIEASERAYTRVRTAGNGPAVDQRTVEPNLHALAALYRITGSTAYLNRFAELAVEPYIEDERGRWEMDERLHFLGRLGPEAMPHLVRIIENGNAKQSEAAMRAISRHAREAKQALPLLIRKAEQLGSDEACYAIASFAALAGPEAVSALPILEGKLKTATHPELVSRIASALAAIGPDARSAVPLLIKRYEEETAESRRAELLYSISILEKDLSALAEKHVPRLLATFAPRHRVRFLEYSLAGNAMRQLYHFAAWSDEIVPLLADMLDFANWRGSGAFGPESTAAVCLGRIGPAAKAAIPELHLVKFRGNDYLRKTAAEALEKIMKPAP